MFNETIAKYEPERSKVLGPSFFARNTLRVAKSLLGKILVVRERRRQMSGRIVETEAYGGSCDAASHAFRGQTPRNRVMFGRAGIAYVYSIHGHQYCLNVVTEKEGVAGAVLIRAIEPLEGIDIMRRNRKMKHDKLVNLTNGPAKLTEALGITLEDNGADLTSGEHIFFIRPEKSQKLEIACSSRTGTTEDIDKLWRLYVENSEFVSG